MRRLAFLAALVLVVPGCDSSLGVDDIRRGFVYELVLEDIPLVQPDGDDWDGGVTSPRPDVYLSLETRGGLILAETVPLANVGDRDLPVVYSIPGVEIGVDEEIVIAAYDDDGLLDDEFMGEIGPFRLREFLGPDLRESFRVASVKEPFEVRVRLDWDD